MRIQLKHIALFLTEIIKEELLRQDHKATGNLEKSIQTSVDYQRGTWHLRGEYLYYGRFVDTGRKAGVRRVPISALIDWIRAKKISLRGNSERSVAFAIQTAIYQKGIPTSGDDSKKRFVGRTLERNEIEIESRIRKAAFESVEIFIENMIEATVKELNVPIAA